MEVLTHKAEVLRRPASAHCRTTAQAAPNSRNRTASEQGLVYGTLLNSAAAPRWPLEDASSFDRSGYLNSASRTAPLGRSALLGRTGSNSKSQLALDLTGVTAADDANTRQPSGRIGSSTKETRAAATAPAEASRHPQAKVSRSPRSARSATSSRAERELEDSPRPQSARSSVASSARAERNGRPLTSRSLSEASLTASRMHLTASGAVAFPGDDRPKENDRLARLMVLAERCAQGLDSDPPVARVKPEAMSNAELAKGKRMAKIIHKYGDVTPRPQDPPRVKPEGEPNAALDRGRRMDLLIHSYGRLPAPPRMPPRIKEEAEEIAYHGQNGLVRHLLDSYGTLPPSPRPASRVKREAWNTAYRARGSMKRTFSEAGKRQFIYVPGLQTKKHARTLTA